MAFLIDGQEYEWPTLDSFDIDEAELLYTATGFGLEDLVFDPEEPNAEDVAKRLIRPATLKALARIAYSRQHPDIPADVVLEKAGKVNMSEAVMALLAIEETDVDPPVSTSEPSRSSETSSPGSLESQSRTNETSGLNGTNSSTEETKTPGSGSQEDDPAITGTPASVTPFRQSPAATLASYGQPT